MTDARPTEKPVTLERLRLLLEAYGARPEAWPADERAAAQLLVERSPVAAAWWREARDLDALLGEVSVDASAALAARVLAAAPQRRRIRRRALIAAVPLAAAALLALWLGLRAGPPRQPPELSVAVGVYYSPTDALLEHFTGDAISPLPILPPDSEPRSDENAQRRPMG